jgi:hypothetical protein
MPRFTRKCLKIFDWTFIRSNLAHYCLEGLIALVRRFIVLVPSLAVKPTRKHKRNPEHRPPMSDVYEK